MITRESFGSAIAPLPDYRRREAWQYVGRLEALIRAMARKTPSEFTPEERDLFKRIEELAP